MGRRSGKGGGGATTIVLKREEAAGHGHHGGAWKVAYADFVTAMMAFFLLMWLLNATSEEQRRGLADYFAPANVFGKSTSGTGQPFGGKTLNSEGELSSDAVAIRVERGPVPVRLAGRVHLELADGEAADRTAQLDRDVPVLRDRELDPEMPAGYAYELPA